MRLLVFIMICFFSCSKSNKVISKSESKTVEELINSGAKMVVLLSSNFLPPSGQGLEGSVKFWSSNRSQEIMVETNELKNNPKLTIFSKVDSQTVFTYNIKSTEKKWIYFDSLNLASGIYIISVQDTLGGSISNYIYR